MNPNPTTPQTDDPIADIVAATLFRAGLRGRVETSECGLEATFECGGRSFHLVATAFGPRAAPATERTFFGQLYHHAEPLNFRGVDLPRWKHIHGWNAQRAPDREVWKGDARSIALEAVAIAIRHAARQDA